MGLMLSRVYLQLVLRCEYLHRRMIYKKMGRVGYGV